jgi:hypothetical protein
MPVGVPPGGAPINSPPAVQQPLNTPGMQQPGMQQLHSPATYEIGKPKTRAQPNLVLFGFYRQYTAKIHFNQIFFSWHLPFTYLLTYLIQNPY